MCLVMHLGLHCKWDLQFIWRTNGRYSLHHIRWFDFKELLKGIVLLFSDCFGLCPFVLNRIKVWWICWQIFKLMSGLCNCILNILSFVKGRIIHDYNWCWREFWQQIVYRPAEKNICIDIAYEQFHRQKNLPINAPVTLARPLACQLQTLWYRLPMGAYPCVRGVSWAKPLSSI